LAEQPTGGRAVAASLPVAGHACGPASLGVGTLGAVVAFGELIKLEGALGGYHVGDVRLVGVFGPVDAAAHEDAEPTVDGELCEFCPLGSSSGGAGEFRETDGVHLAAADDLEEAHPVGTVCL